MVLPYCFRGYQKSVDFIRLQQWCLLAFFGVVGCNRHLPGPPCVYSLSALPKKVRTKKQDG